MASSTPRSTGAPPQAWKVPVLVFAAILVFVLAVFLMAQVAGWWAMVLVPAAFFGLAIAVNVIVGLIKKRE